MSTCDSLAGVNTVLFRMAQHNKPSKHVLWSCFSSTPSLYCRCRLLVAGRASHLPQNDARLLRLSCVRGRGCACVRACACVCVCVCVCVEGGFRYRERSRAKKMDMIMKMRHHAATLIEALFRGHHARLRVAKLRHDRYLGALKMQGSFRVFKARQIAKTERLRRAEETRRDRERWAAVVRVCHLHTHLVGATCRVVLYPLGGVVLSRPFRLAAAPGVCCRIVSACGME